MPLNLAQNPLSSLKIGESNVLKSIVGINQIYPNDTDITAAAFNNAGSTIANTGGNQSYSVSGDIGASFSLTGSSGASPPSGTQTLAVSPTVYQVAIGDQSTSCGAGLRYPVVTITPQGNTVFDPTNLTPTSNVVQSAGPSTVSNSIGLTMSVSNTVYNTITVGSQVRWTQGAAWSVTINYTVGSAGQSAVNYVFGTGASQSGIGYTISNIVPSAGYYNTTQVQYDPYQPPSRSFSAIWTLQSGSAQYVSFGSLISNNTSACYSASPGSITTGNLFP